MKNLRLTPTCIQFSPTSKQSLLYTLSFIRKKNRTVKGGIIFTNLLDEEIKSLNFIYDQPIKVRKEVTWNATTEYNQFVSEDKTLKNKSLKDIKVVWKPEKVIFEDGIVLE